MEKFTLKKIDLSASTEIIKKKELKREFTKGQSYVLDYIDDTLKNFFDSRPLFKEYIDIYGFINKLNKPAILMAHGNSNKEWVYYDGKKEYLVQNWINLKDGKYSGLLLCVCNPKSYTPKSKKSILVVPDFDVDFRAFGRTTSFTLLVPKIGEIDSYVIDYELKRLNSDKK